MFENKPRKIDVMEKVKLRVGDLRPGMYVCDLDRPWLETPFQLQGFEVKDQADVVIVGQWCKHVYIDLMRTKVINVTLDAMTTGSYLASKKRSFDKKDLDTAKQTRKKTSDLMRTFMDEIRFGQSPELELVNEPVAECVSTIMGNPDVMMFLTRLRSKDSYVSQHAFNVCIYAIVVGRLIGLDQQQLQTLGTCGLLLDVGMLTIPEHILHKPGELTAEETAIIQTHTTHGRDILLSAGSAFDSVAEVAYSHHENLDGSGYPCGLHETQLGLNCKIVAIVDRYEAITNPRPCRPAGDHLSAVAILNHEINENKIDKDLALTFISYLGVYPQGTLVELNTGEVAIVLGTNTTQRLRPQILIVLDANKKPTQAFVDLTEKTIDKTGHAYRIARVCRPGDFGINLNDYTDLIMESFG